MTSTETDQPGDDQPAPAAFANARLEVIEKVMGWIVVMWRMDHPDGSAVDAATDLTDTLNRAIADHIGEGEAGKAQ